MGYFSSHSTQFSVPVNTYSSFSSCIFKTKFALHIGQARISMSDFFTAVLISL